MRIPRRPTPAPRRKPAPAFRNLALSWLHIGPDRNITRGREYYAAHFNRPYTSDAQRIDLLAAMLEAGHESQLLLSQDVCAKIDLRSYGGVGYAHIVGEMSGRPGAPDGYRTHGAHAPRGTHHGAPQEARAQVANEQGRGFGEGIF